MSAEPPQGQGKQKHTIPVPLDRITVSPAPPPSSEFGFSPDESSVANLGTAEFIASQACWVWTFFNSILTNVFKNEQSDHVVCMAGGNNNFVVLQQYSNATILVVGTRVNAPPPPPPTLDSLKGTIHVGF